jgi:GH35 family endo-1,4-beta-xylanase
MKRFSLFLLLIIVGFVSVFQVQAAGTFSNEKIDRRIQKYRTREVTLVFRDQSGQPLVNQEITIEQTSHSFLFGCNAFMLLKGSPAQQEIYQKRFADLFNYATLPFYWVDYDSNSTGSAKLRLMAEWCRNHGIRPKGHPLVWYKSVPAWTPWEPLTFENILHKHVDEVVSQFQGLIDAYDVINDCVENGDLKNPIGNWVNKFGPNEAYRRALLWARQANPKAVLLVAGNNSDKYVTLVNQLYKAKVTPDAVGMHAQMYTEVWSNRKLWDVCEKFKKHPVHFTELAVLSGHLKTDNDWDSFHQGWNSTPEGEWQQAIDVKRVYRLLFSHPAVESITWWDLSDFGAWQGAPAGLLRLDLTPKPAYDELYKLIHKDWWTGTLQLQTDQDGKVTFRGFLGQYRTTVNGKTFNFMLDKKTTGYNVILEN